MNNRGFTLVELIAIIVVFVAIFLVSFPALTNVTKSNENQKYDAMIKDLCIAGESYIHSNEEELILPNSKIYVNISSLIEYGNVNKDIINPKTNEIINGDFLIFNVFADNSMDCSYKSAKCIVTKDADISYDLSFLDEVMCGTETFYMIPNDEDAHWQGIDGNVTLLAKYNLNVGSDLIDGPFGIQNKKATGFFSEQSTSCNFTQEYLNNFFELIKDNRTRYIELYNLGKGCNATVPFAETNYWHNEDGFVYNNESLLYPFVENYGKYIESFGIAIKEASIASYNQLKEYFDEDRITNSSFWLGTLGDCSPIKAGGDEKCIYQVNQSGEFNNHDFYESIYFGVRPVIIVSKDYIEFGEEE